MTIVLNKNKINKNTVSDVKVAAPNHYEGGRLILCPQYETERMRTVWDTTNTRTAITATTVWGNCLKVVNRIHLKIGRYAQMKLVTTFKRSSIKNLVVTAQSIKKSPGYLDKLVPYSRLKDNRGNIECHSALDSVWARNIVGWLPFIKYWKENTVNMVV